MIKMTSDVKVNDDFNNKRAKALEEVFDAVARYGEMREKHERTTREAMMSIAAARYALGRVGWESVVGTTKMTTISLTNEEEEEEEEEGREEKRKATCVVALREDNEGGRVFETSFVRAMMNPKEEEEKEEEEEEESERTKMEPAQARVVRRKFRELTRASAEVLSIKSALERKVKRYEREYGSAM